MRQSRGIAAYGRCRDDAGRVLLVLGSAGAEFPGAWRLPGGGILHGEHPADAAVRTFAEETGLPVSVTGVLAVVADVLHRDGAARHTDRVIYDVMVRGGGSAGRLGSPADRLAWRTPGEAAGLPLAPFTAELLGLPVRPVVPAAVPVVPAAVPVVPAAVPVVPAGRDGQTDAGRVVEPEPIQLPVDPAVLGPVPGREPAGGAEHLGAGAVQRRTGADGAPAARPVTGQRFAAYGLVTDPAGRVLLTLISDGYPGAGHWHLPGGGTDHGEQPAAAFLRELTEEAGQVGRLTGLLNVSHRRSMALGPEGYPLDWHAVRVLYRAVVDEPTHPRVTEAAGGSTARAAWFTPAQAHPLPLTEIAAQALGLLATDAVASPR